MRLAILLVASGLLPGCTSWNWQEETPAPAPAHTAPQLPGDVPGTTTIAEGRGHTWGLAVDATGVYWSEDKGLVRLATGASSVEVLNPTDGVGYLAVDEANVDFTEDATYPGADTGLDRVLAIPKSGGAAIVLADHQKNPSSLAIDATHVYWTDLYNGAVRRVPKVGGPIETIAETQSFPDSVGLDAENVYWAANKLVSTGTGELSQVVKKPFGAKPSQPASSVADMLGGPLGVAVDAVNIYIVTSMQLVAPSTIVPGDVITVVKQTGERRVTHGQVDELEGMSRPGFPRNATTASGRVYWTDADTVLSADASGKIEIRGRGDMVEIVAVFDGFVYWTDYSRGRVARAPE